MSFSQRPETRDPAAPRPLEVWGGLEYTVNRVGEDYFNQLQKSRHWERIEDLVLFAELGIKSLRYPMIWELICPEGDPAKADWSWTDHRYERLRELGLNPIAGLVHHGSGPRHTSLVDPGFAGGLAKFARACAERYPWVTDYTPVNEPCTTARFSGLYGFWYPHERNYAAFAKAIVNECRGVVLAMKEIRAVNPKARLIQTDDFGTISGTPFLKYQTDFENERRWLGWDLVCGRVNRDHPLWYTLRKGVSEAELEFFLENPCPPDVIGINYYVTSDRYLDEKMEKYPEPSHGGNEKHNYADIEAVRIPEIGTAGHKNALRKVWERYGIPVAITEVHIDSTREDQLRWVHQAWRACREAKEEGVDVRAMTVWALLGSYDWNSLVTRNAGYYEPGVFDLRSPKPRWTAIGKMVNELSRTGSFEHPLIGIEGWWKRRYPPQETLRRLRHSLEQCHYVRREAGRPVLITGRTGTLGFAFARQCECRGIPFKLLTRAEMDLADPASIARAFAGYDPWAVINAAGYVKVDEAEFDADACYLGNTAGAENLALECQRRGIPLLTFSTDLVFDGTKEEPYLESDRPAPLNVYGASKALAEGKVLAACAKALVVRTSSFFGPWDEYNFLTDAFRKWEAGEAIAPLSDVIVTPTYVPDLVRMCLDLLIDGETGLWHITNPDPVSWAEFAFRAAEIGGYPKELIQPRPLESVGLAARRPPYSALSSERGLFLPPLEAALQRYLNECEVIDFSKARI